MTFSHRTAVRRDANALATLLAELRAKGAPILDLTASNPTTAGFEYPGGLLSPLSDPRALTYAPMPFGLLRAREAVAKAYGDEGLRVDPSRIILTASTSEAYAFLFKLLADDGDDLLVPAPSYPLFELLAGFEGVHLRPYRLAYDGAWHLDAGSVALARSERTRGALLVSPNNPTGSYVKAAELEELAATGLPLVSDEVFAPYALKERRDAPSVLRAEAPLVFALSGLSKLAALPQMKLAWIVVGGSSDALVDEALARLEVLADAALSVGTPVQEALPELLASRHVVQRSIRARLEKNLASLQRIVKDTPVTVLDVEGGWYATLRLPGTETEEAWTLILLEEDAVYVHPGHFFDFVGEAYVVVSLLTREESFDEGVARIVRRVRAATARSTTMVTRN